MDYFVILLAFASFHLRAAQGASLELRNIKITTIVNEPFMMKKAGCTSISKDCAVGFTKDLLDQMSEDLGVTYTLKEVDDGRYGKLEDGKWSGMIGEVSEKRVDMVAADLTLTQERSEVLDFASPYLTHSLSVLMKKLPDVGQRGAVGILAAFDILVWILLIVAVLLVVLVFVIINFLSPLEGRKLAAAGNGPAEDADKFGLLGSLWFAFSNLCWQGFDRTPKSISGRVMTVFWWIFVLFMLVSFTAAVTNYLASAAKPGSELPVNTLDELSQTDEIKLGCLKGGATNQFFDSTETASYQRLDVKMDADKSLFSSMGEALEMVKKGKYGAVLEGPTAEYLEERNCDLRIMPERISSLEKLTAYAYGLRPGLPNLLKAINKKILQYQSDGTIFKLYQKWWIPVDGACPLKRKMITKTTLNQKVTAGNVAVPFGILVLGIALALVTLLLEIFAGKIKEARDEEATPEGAEAVKIPSADGEKAASPPVE